MSSGWIKSYRKINEHELLANDNSAFIVFMKLLHRVDKDTGSYITGRYKLGELVNLKPITAYKTLKRLENAKMVTLKSNNRFTKVHICNWRKYQGNGNSAGNNEVTSGEHQREQRSNTKQEVRSNKRIKNKEVSVTKVTNTRKALSVDNRDPEVTALIGHFEKCFGVSTRDQSYAAITLLKQHGFERSIGAINAVAAARGERYAPSIGSLEELLDKWIKLENFFARTKPKGIIEI